MSDLAWPVDLQPYKVAFYLQPYTLRQTSPFTRRPKIYGLSRPLWVARLTFRGGYDGFEEDGSAAWGAAVDALVTEMDGGANRVALWDFRRPYPPGLRRYYRRFAGETYTFGGGETFTLGEEFYIPAEAEPLNEAAAAGANTMVFSGFLPGERVFQPGDYIGGDGRTHIVQRPGGTADGDGRATVKFDPPLWSDVGGGEATTIRASSWFRLTSDDAGANETEVDGLTEQVLEFVEDPIVGS